MSPSVLAAITPAIVGMLAFVVLVAVVVQWGVLSVLLLILSRVADLTIAAIVAT